MARGGFDYVCIDTQHGAVDYQTTVELIRAVEHGAAERSFGCHGTSPASLGRCSDAGAEGVIVPMVNTVEQAEAAVRACRYAPHGGAEASALPSPNSATTTMSSGLETMSPSSR